MHRQSLFLLRTLCVICGFFLAVTIASAAGLALNLSAWQEVPVLYKGRIMPLDSFARTNVDTICDRVNPTLSLAGISDDDLKLSDFAGAKELFPDGKPRKFSASELLLSWLVEPQRWEHVPFLIAEHDELRKLLEVPVTAADGTHLKYVSPAVVADSDAFRDRLKKLADQQRTAEMNKKPFQLAGVDAKVKELFDAFTAYRQITFNPTQHEGARTRFMEQASQVISGWAKLESDVQMLRGKPQLDELVTRVDTALRTLPESAGSGYFKLEKVEPSVVVAAAGLQEISAECAKLKEKMSGTHGDVPGFTPEQMELAKSRLNRFAAATRLLARQSIEMHSALYDNGDPQRADAIRVVPALNEAALDKNRDVTDESQPWLTLQTVLHGSPELLKTYPQPQIMAVRANWDRLKAAYTKRDGDRAKTVLAAEDDFAIAVRNLGMKTTALRETMYPGRDPDLLKYTAYPVAGSTATEVSYNHTEPFMWSWIISLTALVAFGLAFGVMRKPMFWIGAVVLFMGLAWTAYGFALRVMITQWAPVTNMYETVVYVPFFVSVLGAWFMLLPAIWPGLQSAWRMTAIPGTWEATPATSDSAASEKHRDEKQPSGFGMLNVALLLPRVALMALVFQILALNPYAAGGRTIVNLKPVVDVGSTLPDMNNFVVWLVGICVLLPAVWYLPRVILSLALSLITVPVTLWKGGRELIDQVYVRRPFGMAATFAAFVGALIASYFPLHDRNFAPLQPVLRDNFWLTIHVLTIVSSYGAGMLAWGLGNLSLGHYLFGRYRDPESRTTHKPIPAGFRPAAHDDDEIDQTEPLRLPPEATHTLAGFIYKTIQVAVLLLAAGTILGGLWADVSWGRFWGWDPKEVWALVSLLTYLVILHGRFAGWVGDFGLAAGSVFGATAIVMSWYGVNFVLGAGLHSYGFGNGGQTEVALGLLLNWAFLGAAAIRYRINTRNVT